MAEVADFPGGLHERQAHQFRHAPDLVIAGANNPFKWLD